MPCKNEMWRDGFVPQYLRRKRGFPLFAGARNNRKTGAGGGSRTHTGLAALRIFMPSTAFAASARALVSPRQVCGLDYPFTILRRPGD